MCMNVIYGPNLTKWYSCIEWLECGSVGIDTKAINQFRLNLEYKIGKHSKQNTRLLELSDLGSLFPEHAELLYYKVERKASKPVYLDKWFGANCTVWF